MSATRYLERPMAAPDTVTPLKAGIEVILGNQDSGIKDL